MDKGGKKGQCQNANLRVYCVVVCLSAKTLLSACISSFSHYGALFLDASGKQNVAGMAPPTTDRLQMARHKD